MIKKGIVVAADGNGATIEEIKNTCCFECIDRGMNVDCLSCKNRSQDTSERHISSNNLNVKVGDIVEYSRNTMKNAITTLMMIILPIVLMVATYVILNAITSNDQLSGRIALAVLAVSMISTAAYSYKLSKHRYEYKIISKLTWI